MTAGRLGHSRSSSYRLRATGRARRTFAMALATGMVVIMTGCSSAAEAPTGDALYRDGEDRYLSYATTMHSVIMAIHDGEWKVDQGSWGASPIPCRREGGSDGYAFSWARLLEQDAPDVDSIVAASSAAFEAADMTATTTTYGEGDRQEVNVIATGGPVVRGVVTIRPALGTIRVTAEPGCFPGDAAKLYDMVFAGISYPGLALRVPAFEGPDWQPRFYFPEDGSPVYWNEDGTPIEPPPASTESPVAPYGGGS